MPIQIIDGELYIIKKEQFNLFKHGFHYALHNDDLDLVKYLYKNTDGYMDVNSWVKEAIEYEKQEIIEYLCNEEIFSLSNIEEFIRIAEESECNDTIIEYFKMYSK